MATRHSGFMIQSTLGTVTTGSLGTVRITRTDLVVPNDPGGFAYCGRSDNQPNQPWGTPQIAGSDPVLGLSLIQSNFGTTGIGNLEVVARVGDHLVAFWRPDTTNPSWRGPSGAFATGVSGNPALIQSSFGNRGDFEVIVPRATTGIAHYSRLNDQGTLPWSGPNVFAEGVGHVDAVALLQSNFGHRNLEAIARVGAQLVHFWRDGNVWRGPNPVLTGAAGVPGFIQSRFGRQGNFEIVTPLASGGLAHLWRDNDSGSLPWIGPTKVFGIGVHPIEAVALIQDSAIVSLPGRLEIAGRVDGCAAHYVREANERVRWTEPVGHPPPFTFFGGSPTLKVLYPRGYQQASREYFLDGGHISFDLVFSRPVQTNTLRIAESVKLQAPNSGTCGGGHITPSADRRHVTYKASWQALDVAVSNDRSPKLTLPRTQEQTGHVVIRDDAGHTLDVEGSFEHDWWNKYDPYLIAL